MDQKLKASLALSRKRKSKTTQIILFTYLQCSAQSAPLLGTPYSSLGERDLSALLNGYKSNDRKPSLVAIGTILTLPFWQSINTVRGLVAGASTTYQLGPRHSTLSQMD